MNEDDEEVDNSGYDLVNYWPLPWSVKRHDIYDDAGVLYDATGRVIMGGNGDLYYATMQQLADRVNEARHD